MCGHAGIGCPLLPFGLVTRRALLFGRLEKDRRSSLKNNGVDLRAPPNGAGPFSWHGEYKELWGSDVSRDIVLPRIGLAPAV